MPDGDGIRMARWPSGEGEFEEGSVDFKSQALSTGVEVASGSKQDSQAIAADEAQKQALSTAFFEPPTLPPITALHSTDQAEESRFDLLRRQRADLDARITALDAVVMAARRAVRCIAQAQPDEALAAHTRHRGCLRFLSDAVAALDKEG